MEAPKLIEVLGGEAIVLAACGRNHTLALTGRGWGARKKLHLVGRLAEIGPFCPKPTAACLTESGSVFAFGENKMGQLGLGNQTDAVPSPTQVPLLLPPAHPYPVVGSVLGLCTGGIWGTLEV